ncbi:hypothetical protein SEUCBS140593_010833 [Sporothrix eucalyptigena]|uniref:Ketoreductase domain-containing protein n=1 Tax=Sporothrix eucalyptigena TaxID=1812306 RepID=A0ABP0D5M5_9PEZI
MLTIDDPLIPQSHKDDPHMGVTVTAHIHHDTYDAINPRRLDLTGKSVFITGASRGIGRSIAISYTQAGVSFIALAARGSMEATVEAVKVAAKAANRAMPTLLPLIVEASDPTSVEAAVKATSTALNGKPLDILVNNAAVLEPNVILHKSDPADWWYTFEINLKGVYLTSRAFIPLLLKADTTTSRRGDRTIVNLTSQGGIRVMNGLSAYNTSKLAVCRLTEFLALEYAAEQLVTFSVHPGGVVSDMSKKLPDSLQSAITDTGELVGDSIVYLTRAPQPWLSGRYVSVLWDLQELEARKEEVEGKDLLKNKFVC